MFIECRAILPTAILALAILPTATLPASTLPASTLATATLPTVTLPNSTESVETGDGSAQPPPRDPHDIHQTAFEHRFEKPIRFVQNRGQWTTPFHFWSRMDAVDVRMYPGAFEVIRLEERTEETLSGSCLRFTFEGGDREAPLRGENRTGGRSHYLIGSKMVESSALPLYSSVIYCDLYPGIDVRMREAAGIPEYDLLLSKEADLSQVGIRVEGHRELRISDDGTLEIVCERGILRQAEPKTWQVDEEGRRHEIVCRYVIVDDSRFSFIAESRHPAWETVIDPGLEWSTYLGGFRGDWVYQIDQATPDPRSDIIASGYTISPDFPVTPGAFDTSGYHLDGFISRIDADARQVIYSTYLGGSGIDWIFRMETQSDGTVVLSGRTQSLDFPTTANAFQQDLAIGRGICPDAFVSILSEKGDSLLYSTYLGGEGFDWAYSMDVEPSGAIWVGGQTQSMDFPTTENAWDSEFADDFDGFIARIDPYLDPEDQLNYSTYLGGDEIEFVYELLWEPERLTVVGVTGSADFPSTPGAFDETHNGLWDVFAMRLRLDRLDDPLVYSTFLGGENLEVAYGAKLHPSGDLILAGWTCSPDFPTTFDAIQKQLNGYELSDTPQHPGLLPMDAFLTRLDLGWEFLDYSTYFGGQLRDEAWAIEIHRANKVSIIGITDSRNFLTTPQALDRTFNGDRDVFFSQFDFSRQGVPLTYSTVLGTDGDDQGFASTVDADASGAILIGGFTQSTRFPITPGVFQEESGDHLSEGTAGPGRHHRPPKGPSTGLGDGFLTKFKPVYYPYNKIASWTEYGQGWPGHYGIPTIALTSPPIVGSSIDLEVGNSSGLKTLSLVLIGTQPAYIDTPWGGVVLTQATSIVTLPLNKGLTWTPLQVPERIGDRLFIQALQLDLGASHGVSFTRGLELTAGE